MYSSISNIQYKQCTDYIEYKTSVWIFSTCLFLEVLFGSAALFSAIDKNINNNNNIDTAIYISAGIGAFCLLRLLIGLIFRRFMTFQSFILVACPSTLYLILVILYYTYIYICDGIFYIHNCILLYKLNTDVDLDNTMEIATDTEYESSALITKTKKYKNNNVGHTHIIHSNEKVEGNEIIYSF